MRNMFVIAIIVGLCSALSGAFAVGRFAEAGPPPQAVVEQNKDGDGLIRVHEQGTSNVRDLDNLLSNPSRRFWSSGSAPFPALALEMRSSRFRRGSVWS